MKSRIITTITLVLLIAAGVFFWSSVSFSEPDFVQGIPTGDQMEASRAFNDLILKKFPKGSDVKPLVTFLIHNDFEQSFRFDHWKSASHVSGFLCPNYWRINWQSDENMKIKDIEGNWDNDCY